MIICENLCPIKDPQIVDVSPFYLWSIETQKHRPVPLFCSFGLKGIVPVIFSEFLNQIQVVFSEQ